MSRTLLAKWQIHMRYRVLTRDKRTCQYCLRKGNTIDHIIPLSKGGNWLENNIVAACFECNTLKKSETIHSFLRKHKDHLARFRQDTPSIMERIRKAQTSISQWGPNHVTEMKRTPLLPPPLGRGSSELHTDQVSTQV